MKINILGSCYTRELFNYTDRHSIECYVLQQSLFTMFTTPLPIDIADASSVDGTNFMNRMMYYEFNKLGLPAILKTKADKLIIDLVDCRYDIYELNSPKGSKIIYTHDSRATFDNLAKNNKYINLERQYINVPETFSDDTLREIVSRLCTELLKVYKPEDIILNRVNMAKYYYENGKKIDFKNNFHLSRESFVQKIENLLIEFMPNICILNVTTPPLVDINHRFGGPHPMHYESIYYRYKMQILEGLLTDTDTLELAKKEYEKALIENLDSIQAKTHNKSADCKSTKRVD